MTVFSKNAQEIYNNNIMYEFSKKSLKNPTHKMYLYEKSPIKEVTGYILIESIGIFNPEIFYKENQIYCDTYEKDFLEKYNTLEKITVYKIKSAKKFNKNVTLDKLGKKAAPQSIQYIDNKYEII